MYTLMINVKYENAVQYRKFMFYVNERDECLLTNK